MASFSNVAFQKDCFKASYTTNCKIYAAKTWNNWVASRFE